MRLGFCFFMIATVLGISGCASTKQSAKPLDNPWGRVTRPSSASQGTPKSIGKYGAGCVDGAVPLEKDGPGYQVMRLSRLRYYGHPELVGYIRRLGAKVARQRLGVMLIGDLGQARGGPMLSGHASHQNGLDVDVWFWVPDYASKRKLTDEERENLSALTMVNSDGATLNQKLWSPSLVKLLRLAAREPGVDRIFVNAAIKKELCRTKKPADAAWLRRVRPWWGHDDHLHIRLLCPKGQSECTEVEPMPEGDGCDATLDWWFSDEAKEIALKLREQKPEPRMPILPAACEGLIKDNL